LLFGRPLLFGAFLLCAIAILLGRGVLSVSAVAVCVVALLGESHRGGQQGDRGTNRKKCHLAEFQGFVVEHGFLLQELECAMSKG
jgi:hypothetical protein